MSARVLAVLALLLATACISQASDYFPALEGLVTISFEGDSITYGSGDPAGNGFRLLISDALTAAVGTTLPAGMTFSYIGGNTSGVAPTDHHSGFPTTTIQYHLASVAPVYYGLGKPYNCDVIVLLIGTNNTNTAPNLAQGQTDYPTLTSLIRNRIRQVKPNTRLVIVQVPPIHDVTRQAWTDTLNGTIASVAAALQTDGGPPVFIVPPTALVYPGDYTDNIHPSVAGYAKMAADIAPYVISAITAGP